MKFEVHMVLEVDPDANFLETFGDNREVMSEIMNDLIYDLDDVKIIQCEVEND